MDRKWKLMLAATAVAALAACGKKEAAKPQAMWPP